MHPGALPTSLRFPALLLAAAAALAAGPPDDGAVTVIGTNTLAKSQLVARGKLERVSALPFGLEMGTVKVEEVLWADRPGTKPDSVQVLSNEPGYFSSAKEESIWFLKRLEGRARYECAGIVDLGDRDGAARLAAVRRSLEIESLPAGLRAEALREACFEGLGAPDAWTRQNAGRELAHLAGLRPGAFTAADAGDVAERAMGEGDRILRPLLVEAAESLARAGARGELAPGEGPRVSLGGAAAFRALREEKDPAKRAEAVAGVGAEPGAAADGALVGALREDPAPAVRTAAARALSTRPRAAAATAGLVEALRRDGEPAVRAAAAEALGILGAAEGIRDLRAACGEAAPLGRAALFALGRIATPAAEEALKEFRATAAAEVGELVEFLLSADFRRQEEMLRRMREGREGR